MDEVVRSLTRMAQEERLDPVRATNMHGLQQARSSTKQKEIAFAEFPDFADDEGEVTPFLDRKLIKFLLTEKALRLKHFNPDLVQGASWTMLLELAWADLEGLKVSVTSLCFASGAPGTTALRYIGVLEGDGMIERRPDMEDGRRTYVSLTLRAKEILAKMLQELRVKSSKSHLSHAA